MQICNAVSLNEKSKKRNSSCFFRDSYVVRVYIAYGIYMKALGFGFLYPTLMALLIYAGSVEFIAAGALIAPFSPISVLLITLMISARQIFYGISMLEKYGIHIGKNAGI